MYLFFFFFYQLFYFLYKGILLCEYFHRTTVRQRYESTTLTKIERIRHSN